MHYNNIVVDGHNDTMMHVIDRETWKPIYNIGESRKLHIDIDKLKAGGLNCPMFAAFSEGYYGNIGKSLSRTLAIINALHWTEDNNEDFKIIKRIDELKDYRDDEIYAISTVEGAYFIDENNYRDILIQLKDIGVKIIGFNWNYSNLLGEGVWEVYSDGETKSKGGLTDLGIKVLKEMEKLGLGIDVSHMNESTFKGVVKNYNGPIIATHSNAYTIKKNRRNLKDYQLKNIRNSNGVVGTVFSKGFIAGESSNIKDIVDHIDYMVELIGVDYISLGSDFDGTDLPEDLKDSSQLYKITDELISRGYDYHDVKKILGNNYIRVLKEIEVLEKVLEEVNIKNDLKQDKSIKNGDLINYTVSNINIKNLMYRIIVDGIEMEKSLLKDNEISYRIDLKNEEFFHIITLEIYDDRGFTKRMTDILYNEV